MKLNDLAYTGPGKSFRKPLTGVGSIFASIIEFIELG